jgi:hypothetical protein
MFLLLAYWPHLLPWRKISASAGGMSGLVIDRGRIWERMGNEEEFMQIRFSVVHRVKAKEMNIL